MSDQSTNPPLWATNAIQSILRVAVARAKSGQLRNVFAAQIPVGLALCSWIFHDRDDDAVDLALSFRPSVDELANAFADHANGEVTPPVASWETLADGLVVVWITPTDIVYRMTVAKPSAAHDLLRLQHHGLVIDLDQIVHVFRNADRRRDEKPRRAPARDGAAQPLQ
jgi:hypothetical protein